MALHGGDGENVTLGRKADTKVLNPADTASVVALLKGLLSYSAGGANLPVADEILLELRRIRFGVGLMVGADLESEVSA